jgi:hypothetical protein
LKSGILNLLEPYGPFRPPMGLLYLHLKCPSFSCDLKKLHYRFSKNIQTSNLKKTRQVRAELFKADGRPDIRKPIAPFRNFANAPKTLGVIFRSKSFNYQSYWRQKLTTVGGGPKILLYYAETQPPTLV